MTRDADQVFKTAGLLQPLLRCARWLYPVIALLVLVATPPFGSAQSDGSSGGSDLDPRGVLAASMPATLAALRLDAEIKVPPRLSSPPLGAAAEAAPAPVAEAPRRALVVPTVPRLTHARPPANGPPRQA